MNQQSVMDAILNRRAVRSYTAEKVTADEVRTLLRAAVHAPTAMHMEPWAFVVIQDPMTLKRISDRAKALMLTAAASDGHRLAHHPAAPPPDQKNILADPEFNVFYDASTLIVICAKPMGTFVTADCWLAAQNIMLAAHAMGLGTCPIGLALGALNNPRTKQELGIPEDDTAVAPIIVGVPQAVPPAVKRKEPDILAWK